MRIQRIAEGDQQAMAELVEEYQPRLVRFAALRLDSRVRARVDPEEVVQEVFVEVLRRAAGYASNPGSSPAVWLFGLTLERVIQVHRQHLEAQARDPRREIRLHDGPTPAVDSGSLASLLVGRLTTPSQAAMRAERQQRIQDALRNLDETDREVLVLRHFDELSNVEAAELLGLTPKAASMRFVRALQRLRAILGDSCMGKL
jgi:RNA polymerase sigma-70 factor (ECF subfamily)